MDDILGIVDAIEAKCWHLSCCAGLHSDDNDSEKDRRAFYDAQRGALRDLAAELKRSIHNHAEQIASAERSEPEVRDLLLIEMGGQLTAFMHGSAAEAEMALSAAKEEHASLDWVEWRAVTCRVDIPPKVWDSSSSIDLRHVLIIWRDSWLFASIHNTVDELQEAIEDFEYTRSDPANNNVEEYSHHRILIPRRSPGNSI